MHTQCTHVHMLEQTSVPRTRNLYPTTDTKYVDLDAPTAVFLAPLILVVQLQGEGLG